MEKQENEAPAKRTRLRQSGEPQSSVDITTLSLSLAPPNLASAIDNPAPVNPNPTPFPNPHSASNAGLPNQQSTASAVHDSDVSESGVGDDDELGRPQKKPRTVWTPELHKRFIDATEYLGMGNVTASRLKTIMDSDGLCFSRAVIASHLQKYRDYLNKTGRHSAGNSSASSAACSTDTFLQYYYFPLLSTGGDASAEHNLNRGIKELPLFPTGGAASAEDDLKEKSEEECRETKELPLFPTGKD